MTENTYIVIECDIFIPKSIVGFRSNASNLRYGQIFLPGSDSLPMKKSDGQRNSPYLYLGDDNVSGAAGYLAGVMAYFGLEYIHYPSDRPLDSEILTRNWSAVVISDYPAARIAPELMHGIVEMVSSGTGLLMIGGWDSFQGQGGGYFSSPVGDILPVILEPGDDRVNSSAPCLAAGKRNHPIVGNLPFDTDSPGIGGFNRFRAKNTEDVILEYRMYRASVSPSGAHELTPESGPGPLLVAGRHGRGRVTAWASDVAPHWVGGLVDWGPERVETRGSGDAGIVEVGNLYAEFFRNMLLWTAGRET
jgi:hypothetical protein